LVGHFGKNDHYISDGYSVHGTVKKIEFETVKNGLVYYFHLEEGHKITVLR
jgi:hypothetical protein